MTALTWMLEGKFSAMKSESNSASAPPKECPICVRCQVSAPEAHEHNGPGKGITHQHDLGRTLVCDDSFGLRKNRGGGFRVLGTEPIVDLNGMSDAGEKLGVQVGQEEVDIRQVRQPVSCVSERVHKVNRRGHSQGSGIRAFVGDHDRVLLRPVADEDCRLRRSFNEECSPRWEATHRVGPRFRRPQSG